VRLPVGAINVLLCDLNRRLISLGVALLPAELLLLILPVVPLALPGAGNGGLFAGMLTGLDIILLFTAVSSGDVFSLAGTLGPDGREGSKK